MENERNLEKSLASSEPDVTEILDRELNPARRVERTEEKGPRSNVAAVELRKLELLGDMGVLAMLAGHSPAYIEELAKLEGPKGFADFWKEMRLSTPAPEHHEAVGEETQDRAAARKVCGMLLRDLARCVSEALDEMDASVPRPETAIKIPDFLRQTRKRPVYTEGYKGLYEKDAPDVIESKEAWNQKTQFFWTMANVLEKLLEWKKIDPAWSPKEAVEIFRLRSKELLAETP